MTPCPAIAVGKRVDRFKLVVHHGESDQRVDVLGFVNIALPISELVTQKCLALGRRVNY